MIGMLFHSAQNKRDNSSYAMALDHEQQSNQIPDTLHSLLLFYNRTKFVLHHRTSEIFFKWLEWFISSIKWMNERKNDILLLSPLDCMYMFDCVCVFDFYVFLVYLFTWPKYISYDFRSRLTDSQNHSHHRRCQT